ncbi:peptide-methionine (S)-S-oxide reductase MsrA [Marivirga arenosa]|uniref:Peptide methionine sulfoxide reductase MsrA n=1 Tax=Marivirga arenosa TaxID=3059076 RepID=A0AA49GHL5_9BACT|nr:peptide-methionine (S)-S-oxide reductase MsrA [Marivirga sp. ABR2-2]WKK84431.1 peptide-methionine (S)-S-oxide reductase MsrA [Marivirga sp. ABR2-2]
MSHSSQDLEKATLGAGCFWCIDAVLRKLKGVQKVESGFSGGHIKNPPYREVVQGRTGHAEVANITFDPSIISYQEILEVFWQVHDPTTLNRQGADVGEHYRSIILTHNSKQAEIAQEMKLQLDQSGIFDDPIVTEIKAFEAFYPAETAHQDFYNRNVEMPYCTFVIKPKLDKIKRLFTDKLK